MTIIIEISKPFQIKPGKAKMVRDTLFVFRVWWLWFSISVTKRPLPFIVAPTHFGLFPRLWEFSDRNEEIMAQEVAQRFRKEDMELLKKLTAGTKNE